MSVAAAPHRGMRSALIAHTWQEGFPTGNGVMGALVHGGPDRHVILLNHEGLFLPLPENRKPFIPDMADCLPRVRELLRRGKSAEASAWFRDQMIARGFPKDLVWTDPFHPAFQLEISIPGVGAAQGYLRELDFQTGEVRISWTRGGGQNVLRLFVSRPDGVVVISVRGHGPLDCTVSLRRTPGAKLVRDIEMSAADGGWLRYQANYEAGEGGYCGAVRVEAGRVDARRGKAVCSGSAITVGDADEVLLLAAVEPARDAARAMEDLTGRLAGLPAHYDALLRRHARIHGELFGRVSLDLGGEAGRADTNESLLSEARGDGPSPALVERAHDFGRFCLIASSGRLPPNLQGVWNGTWSPPWSSDYTLDENLQMMTWQALPGGLTEAAEAAVTLVEGFVEDWRTNARAYYGCRGIMSSARSSRSGLHRHFSVEFPLEFWTAGAGWLGQLFWDYWLFTGDREFLRRRTVPYLREVAAFYMDFACRDDDGRMELNPSYSPENTPAGGDNAASINATMDIAVARESLANLIEACRVLDLADPDEPGWRAFLAVLPPYRINADGSLAEWAHPLFEDNVHHRHSSHLYPVFPGFEGFSDPGLYKACAAAARLRLTDGIEAITGWGLAHLANAAARLRDGELAWAAVSRILSRFTLDNMFTTHNQRELFQLDAAMGLSAAVLEMLVISRPGRLELLPALPAALSKGSLRGLRCRGALTLDLQWDVKERRLSFTILPHADQTLLIVLPGRRELPARLAAGRALKESITLG